MEPVPVAEKLLKTKLFGFSVKRLLQAFIVPISPGVILMVLNFPPLIFGPAVLGGMIVGVYVYVRTPAGQNPASWILGRIKHSLGPDRYHWKPVQAEEGDIEIQTGPNSSKTLKNPDENYKSTPMIGDDNTVKNIDFNAIHDDGVIETDETYSLMIEIDARPWLILDGQSRKTVYNAFRQFLMGLKAPIQIFTLPVPYDAGEYIDNLRETNKNKPENESELLEHGRVQHANWLENVVKMGQIRDRRHFIIVTAQKHTKNERKTDSSGLVKGMLNKGKVGGNDDVDKEKRYDDVWSRAENVTNALPRTGVETTILNEREDVLKVLYYYYKGESSPARMDHGWLSKPSESDEHSAKESAKIIN